MKYLLRTFQVLLATTISNLGYASSNTESEPWSVDPNFSADHTGVNGRVYAIAEDSIGRFYLGGYFSRADGQDRQGIARFMSNGELDYSFDPGFGVAGGTFDYVTDCIALDDHSVIIVGDFQEYDREPRGGIARILEDGTVDPVFANHVLIPGANQPIRCIEPLPNGHYIIGGNFRGYAGETAEYIAVIDEEGRYNPDFNSEFTLSAHDDFIDEIAVLDNGDYIVAGRFSTYQGHPTLNIARVLADGDVDTSFTASVTDVQYLESLEIAENGDILTGGTNNGSKLFRLDSTGTPVSGFDTDLNDNFYGGIYDLLELSGGYVLVVGYFDDYSPPRYENCVILNSNGSLDQSLLTQGLEPQGGFSTDGSIITIHTTPAGKLYLGGDFVEIGGIETNRVARINASGLNSGFITFADETLRIQEGRSATIALSVNQQFSDPIDLEFAIVSTDPEILANAWISPVETIDPDQSDIWVWVDYDNNQINTEETSFEVSMTNSALGISDRITITVTDDEVPGTVFFTKTSYLLNEEDGTVSLQIGRHLNDPGSLDVRVQTEDLTARAGVDYIAHDSVHTFPENVYAITVELQAFENTPEPKPLSKFTAGLYARTASTTVGSVSLAYISVNDKDDPGSVIKAPNFPGAISSVIVDDLELGTDGVIYGVAAYTHSIPSRADSKLFRINSNDEVEILADLPTSSPYLRFNDLEMGFDGFLYIAGRDIVRYSTDGVKDTSFVDSISGFNEIRRLFCLPDGKLLAAGRIQESIGGYGRLQIARLFSDGSVDPDFDVGTIGPLSGASWIYEVLREPSGKFLIVGNYITIQGEVRHGIARIWPDGTLDPSFDSRIAQANKGAYSSYGAAIDTDGSVYLRTNRGVLKLNSDGSAASDFTVFTGNPQIQPDGKILSNGTERYFKNGAPDPSLDVPGVSGSSVSKTLFGLDGRLYTYGIFSSFDGKDASGLAIQRGDPGTIPAKLNWQAPSVYVGEGIGTGTTLIERSGNTEYLNSVFYSTIPGSATGDGDVLLTTGYIQFAPDATTAPASFELANDSLLETEESFSLRLHDPSRNAALLGSTDQAVTIIDDDGATIEAWLSRFYPETPLNTDKLTEDTDGDGDLALIEWLNETSPRNPSSIKHPFSGRHLVPTPEGNADHFGLSFYMNIDQNAYKYVVESRPDLMTGDWETIWDSSEDLAREASEVLSKPETGSGWMTIGDAEPMGNRGYLRLRYIEMAE
ncbi:MAG: Calx-beta domain-containing protein [Opitutaceae bacterium]